MPYRALSRTPPEMFHVEHRAIRSARPAPIGAGAAGAANMARAASSVACATVWLQGVCLLVGGGVVVLSCGGSVFFYL